MSNPRKTKKIARTTKDQNKAEGAPDAPGAKAGKTPKAKKAPAAPNPKRVSLLDAAAQVLNASGGPMNCKAMVEAVVAKPDQPRGAPEKGESNVGVAQSILNAMERMREQRVKQLASRIAESALGIGRIKADVIAAGKKRQQAQIDQPCHAVVIENLTNYRPEETRTRRENRQLMSWSSSKVKKYLSEACKLHGLHLRQVPAGYTSRQDSRTGAPGVRCADVPLQDFLTKPWWRKQVNVARKKTDEKNGGSARDDYLLSLDSERQKIPPDQLKNQRPLRIPVNGGELFVSAVPCGCCKREDRKGPPGLQADLNAAANIGLKALLDPDWTGIGMTFNLASSPRLTQAPAMSR